MLDCYVILIAFMIPISSLTYILYKMIHIYL